MISYCSTPLPESVCIDGKDYPIHTDFFVWVQVLALIRQLDTTGDDIARQTNAKVMTDIVNLAFVRPADLQGVDINHILLAVQDFSGGFPHARQPSYSEGEDYPVVSFEYDLNLIAKAIEHQSGLDLSASRKQPVHWWTFLLEFEALEDRHAISKIISTRSYKGDSKELIKAREKERIPIEYVESGADRRASEEFDKKFK